MLFAISVRSILAAASMAVAALAVQAQELRPWMHPEIAEAWQQGFKGQNTTVTFVDDFNGTTRLSGILGDATEAHTHGEWTSMETGMLATDASVSRHDFSNTSAVTLVGGRLNTLNLSYGMMAQAGYSRMRWNSRESSIIAAARRATAVVVKSAGNDGVAIATVNKSGKLDYLSRDLIGADTAIFVGALTAHGTVENPTSMAWYSNYAGSNTMVQSHFLVVGVPGNLTGLQGTSFAAPAVSAYAAILGSKFASATPHEITSQLLNTARSDTIRSFAPNIHGRGEASILRALAPDMIR
ncbi:S8 family serine peptidase [Paracoccus sp. (in: a-proteobacteria)]|uniref:S8 family serine peptidase n=1 Tax=Paracoccus sp. TaxID=267 RepID=UPI003A888DD4